MDFKQTLKELIHDATGSISIEINPPSARTRKSKQRNITYLDYDNPKFLRNKRRTNFKEYFSDSENNNASNIPRSHLDMNRKPKTNTQKASTTGKQSKVEATNKFKSQDSLSIKYNQTTITCSVIYNELTRIKLGELNFGRFCTREEMETFSRSVENYSSIPQFFEDHIISTFDVCNTKTCLTDMFNFISYFKVYSKFAILENIIREGEILILFDSGLKYKQFIPESEFCILSIKESLFRDKISACRCEDMQLIKSKLYSNNFYYGTLHQDYEEVIEEGTKERDYLRRTINILKFQILYLKKALNVVTKDNLQLARANEGIIMNQEEILSTVLSIQSNSIEKEIVYKTDIIRLHEKLSELFYEKETLSRHVKEKFNIDIDIIEGFIFEAHNDDNEEDEQEDNIPKMQNSSNEPTVSKNLTTETKRRLDLCLICGVGRRAIVFMKCQHCVLCHNCFLELSQPIPKIPRYETLLLHRTIACIVCGTSNSKNMPIKFT
jgi:hypothetical protein